VYENMVPGAKLNWKVARQVAASKAQVVVPGKLKSGVTFNETTDEYPASESSVANRGRKRNRSRRGGREGSLNSHQTPPASARKGADGERVQRNKKTQCFNCGGAHRLHECKSVCTRCKAADSKDNPVRHFYACTLPLKLSNLDAATQEFARKMYEARSKQRKQR
jgi:hypothetical protein